MPRFVAISKSSLIDLFVWVSSYSSSTTTQHRLLSKSKTSHNEVNIVKSIATTRGTTETQNECDNFIPQQVPPKGNFLRKEATQRSARDNWDRKAKWSSSSSSPRISFGGKLVHITTYAESDRRQANILNRINSTRQMNISMSPHAFWQRFRKRQLMEAVPSAAAPIRVYI